MTETGTNMIKCRNCGNANLKVYNDGSGFCIECNNSFADINDYEKKQDITAGDPESLFTKKDRQPDVSKWKDPQTYMPSFVMIFGFIGLIFLVLAAWHFYLSIIINVFTYTMIPFIICGILFIITSMSINDNEFKRAFNVSIMNSILLLLFLGLFLIVVDIVIDYTILCPISFLLFIVFSAFLFLRMDKTKRKQS